MIDKNLLKYCTDKQKEYLEAVESVGSIRGAAKKLGICYGTISNGIKAVKNKAASHGYSPDCGWNHPVPDEYFVKDVNTLYDGKGNTIRQWVKSSIRKSDVKKYTLEVIKELCKDVPRIKYSKPSKSIKYEDKLIVYPIADLHLGMLSWAKESGDDYDTHICEGIMHDMVSKIVDRSPSCEECLIANLGDFFHCDNFEYKTSRSGNILDVDGRYSKIFKQGIRLIRYLIEYAAQKHKKVTVINSLGNHDDLSSLVLSTALSNIYENEPRIVINDAPTPRHYYAFGNSLIMTTHGHEVKMSELPILMATECREMWGFTKYHYVYTGHIHQDKLVEIGDCKVESFRTIASKDSWSNAKGFKSGRDLKCIIFDKNHGEIERYTFNLDYIDVDKYRTNR